jgi:hypothetical protein
VTTEGIYESGKQIMKNIRNILALDSQFLARRCCDIIMASTGT